LCPVKPDAASLAGGAAHDISPPMTQDLQLIAWDFDGVLNRNIVNGRFVWADGFESDFGHPFSSLQAYLSGDTFEAIVTGRRDLRDAVGAWTRDVGFEPGPDVVLDYWFAQDSLADPDMWARLDAMRARGLRQVIATNNEDRRCTYIEQEMGFGPRIDGMFSSGRMGVRKPDARFFEIIERETGVPPSAILLVDDTRENIAAARARGWKTFHYSETAGPDLDKCLSLS
jgi:putative hydrolase of the HAD superfamily